MPARVARSTARAAALAKNKEKAAAGAPRAMPAQVMGRAEQCAARAPWTTSSDVARAAL